MFIFWCEQALQNNERHPLNRFAHQGERIMSNDTQGKGNNQGSLERNTSRPSENGRSSGSSGSGGSSSGSSQTRNSTGDRVAGILGGKS